MAENWHIANLGFILNYDDGFSNDEVESELFRLAWQVKGLTHFDRGNGGSFENLEQEPRNTTSILLHFSDFIESIYRLNEARSFEPFISVGYTDITDDSGNIVLASENLKNGVFPVHVQYRIIQDMTTNSEVIIET